MIICLGSMLPLTSSDLPDNRPGRPIVVRLSAFGLASDGVYMATDVTTGTVVSYTAFSPLPRAWLCHAGGGISLLHWPGSHLHRTLSGILPYEARTFLTSETDYGLQAAIICPTRNVYKIIPGTRNRL